MVPRRTFRDEELSARLDQAMETLRAVEAQGGRNEALLADIKGRVLLQLSSQAAAISSSATTAQLAVASAMPVNVTVSRPQRALVTFSGSAKDAHGKPVPLYRYHLQAAAIVTSGPSGHTTSVNITVIPEAGADFGDSAFIFLERCTIDEGMERFRRQLRELPQNQGLHEVFEPQY